MVRTLANGMNQRKGIRSGWPSPGASRFFPQDWERRHLAGVDGVEHAGKMPALPVRSQRPKKVISAHIAPSLTRVKERELRLGVD